jgi:pimeloyl-ACP methyl ester carboxylesterase
MSTPLLAYSRRGSGERLLLLHGLGTTRADFDSLLDGLGDFDVISMDLPGHGGSDMIDEMPTVAALTDAVCADLDAHGLDRVHVLGNSLGGRVAIELGRRQRTRSIVAISQSGMGAPFERLHQGTLMAAARFFNQLLRPWIEALSTTPAGRSVLLAGLRASPWSASPAEAAAVKGGFAEQTGFWSTLWYGIMIDLPTGLDSIDCPVIVAQGSLDVVGSGQTPRYAPLIRDARFVLLPLAGHAPQSDCPGQIVETVREVAGMAARAGWGDQGRDGAPGGGIGRTDGRWPSRGGLTPTRWGTSSLGSGRAHVASWRRSALCPRRHRRSLPAPASAEAESG